VLQGTEEDRQVELAADDHGGAQHHEQGIDDEEKDEERDEEDARGDEGVALHAPRLAERVAEHDDEARDDEQGPEAEGVALVANQSTTAARPTAPAARTRSPRRAVARGRNESANAAAAATSVSQSRGCPRTAA
jgi:hypothetical protein